MDTGEHIKNNTDDDSQSSAVFGRMRKHKDPLISALNQRVLGSNPSASTIPINFGMIGAKATRLADGLRVDLHALCTIHIAITSPCDK